MHELHAVVIVSQIPVFVSKQSRKTVKVRMWMVPQLSSPLAPKLLNPALGAAGQSGAVTGALTGAGPATGYLASFFR